MCEVRWEEYSTRERERTFFISSATEEAMTPAVHGAAKMLGQSSSARRR